MVFDRLRFRFLIVMVCALSRVSSAAAEASAAERETARGLMQEGDRLRTAGDLRGALSRYQSAHAIMHVPTTGLDVARTQAQLGLLVEARGVALEVSNTAPVANEPRVFTEARTAATELAAQLDARIPSIKTQVAPNGAPYSLTIDGVRLPLEARDVAFRTDPGLHRLVIAATGYVSQTREVTLAESQAVTLTVDLVPGSSELQPAAAPVAAAGATAASALGSMPPAAASGREQSDVDPARGGRIRSILSFSVGGALLLAGAVTGASAMSKAKALKDDCPDDHCSAALKSRVSSAKTFATVADITIPLGLLAVGYGLFELLTLPDAPDKEHAAAFRIELTATGALLKGTL